MSPRRRALSFSPLPGSRSLWNGGWVVEGVPMAATRLLVRPEPQFPQLHGRGLPCPSEVLTLLTCPEVGDMWLFSGTLRIGT